MAAAAAAIELEEKGQESSWTDMLSALSGIKLLSALLVLLKTIIPSPFTRKIFHDAQVESLAGKARPTSYLDGYKGLATWFVFNTHLSPLITRTMGAGWGHPLSIHSFLQLPFIHFIHAGGFPIHIFFVINGLVVSFSAVKAMNKLPRQPGDMMSKISLGVFRRPLRLFLPSFASTIFVFWLVRLDAFQWVDRTKNDDMYGGWPLAYRWPPRLDSFWAQCVNLLHQDLRQLRVLERTDGVDYDNIYNHVLWTTPVQYQGTLLVILGHVATFFMPGEKRILTLLIIIGLSIAAGQFLLLSFLFGWLLAELDAYTPATAPAQLELNGNPSKTQSPNVTKAVWWSVLIGSLYLASYPRFEPEQTYGFITLYNLTPPSLGVSADLWHSVAAFLSIWAIGKLPILMTILSIPYFRYIGRLAFAIYLTHDVMNQTLGILAFDFIWGILGKASTLTATLGFVIGYLFVWFMAIWIGDVWVRTVEEWCSIGADKIEKLLFKGDKPT